MADEMKGAMFGKVRELPMGLKRKEYRVADGAGGLEDYPDTAEEIASVQGKESGMIRGHKMKPGQRQ